MKKWYAVQYGDNYEWDYGSTVKREAERMARAMINDPAYDGEEIRIAVIDTNFNHCIEEIILRIGIR